MLYVADPRPQAAIREAFDSRLPPWTPGDEHWLCLVVRDRLTHTPLGLTGYQHHQRDIAEVGFLFAPAAQGRGYGYESLRALCDYAFTTGGVRRLTASVTAGNEASSSYCSKPASGWRGSCGKTTGSTDAGTTTGCSVGCVGGRCAVAHRRSQAGGSQDQRNIPPGDFHTLRVHPRQLIAEQGGDGVADIIRQPNAPQRSLGGDMPIHLGVIAHLPAAKVGLNGPRRDDVHRYPPSAQLFRLIAGQNLHRPLHRGVGRA